MIASGTESTACVLFSLGSEQYGLPVSAVASIVRFKDPTPVPRAVDGVIGVVNLRGRILPVLDLGRRFSGLPFVPTPSSRILVTEGDRGVLGIAVDEANEVATFDAEAIKPVPDGLLSQETAKLVTGMVERPAGLVILLDAEEILPHAEEHEAIPSILASPMEEETHV